MNAKQVNILIWDTPENFDEHTQNTLVKNAYKNVIRFNTRDEFDKIYKNLKDDEYFVVCCHVAFKDFSGYLTFKNSQIKEEFNISPIVYLSSGDSGQVMKKLRKEHNESVAVIKYNELIKNIRAGEVKPLTKKSLQPDITNNPMIVNKDFADIAIITALEEDEMEKALTIIEKEKEIKGSKHLIEYGHFTNKKDIKIAYASQHQTGMVDAAILATELILTFNPKYLIMLGILGGKPDDGIQIGDIVVATKIFTIDKGKYDELGFHKENEGGTVDEPIITKIIRNTTEIKRYIEDSDKTRNKQFNIHFGPIACVRQVIDLEGFFQENISEVDRKAIAIEMESYGVFRACELINEGKTIPLIIKGVMDNTKDKNDDAKPLAAWNSVKLLEYLLENELLDFRNYAR